jgi:hypothetical protein
MSMLKQTNKGPYMNTLEQFYIQQFAYNKRLIPEQNIGDYYPIFPLYLRHSKTSLPHVTVSYLNTGYTTR